MKKILFNCSTNIQGGAAQNAGNFVINSLTELELGKQNCEYYYILSPEVKKILDDYGYVISNYSLIKKSPSKNLSSRKLIKLIESRFNPDLIFTMAGPSYVDFSAPHIMGCSNPYIIFAKFRDILFGRSLLISIYRFLQTTYQKFYIKKAEYFIFQSNASKKSFSDLFNIDDSKTFVVPNAMGIASDDLINRNATSLTQRAELTILCPFENYPHKGLHVIPSISARMSKKYKKFTFVVTASPEFKIHLDSKYSQYLKFISLIGKQPYQRMANLYHNSCIVFMPSILEIFSSVCIEALFFKRPLVVADREFNREILGQYAFYCDPFSAQSCYDAINAAYEIRHNDKYLEAASSYISSKYGAYSNRYSSINKILMDLVHG